MVQTRWRFFSQQWKRNAPSWMCLNRSDYFFSGARPLYRVPPLTFLWSARRRRPSTAPRYCSDCWNCCWRTASCRSGLARGACVVVVGSRSSVWLVQPWVRRPFSRFQEKWNHDSIKSILWAMVTPFLTKLDDKKILIENFDI